MTEAMSDLEKILILGDLHVPFQDDKALDCVIQYAKKTYKPTTIIMDADMLDFYSLSQFDKNPGRITNIQQDLNYINDFLYQLRKDFPKANIYYLEGNHESVHKNTDILTIGGWKKVSDVSKNDLVGQFDIKTKTISFAKPLELIKHKSDFLIDIESNNHHQCVTMNHDVIINDEKIKAHQLLNKNIMQNNIPQYGFLNSNGINLSDDWISLLTWVIMDGCLVKPNKNSIKRTVQFKLSKQKKIEELKKLLNKMNIEYTFNLCKKNKMNKLQPYYIRIYSDYAREIFEKLNNVKIFPNQWVNMNTAQLKILLNAIVLTDGFKCYNHIKWVTTSKKNVDVIQQLCLQNGINCYYKEKKHASGFKNGKIQYLVSIFNQGIFNNKLKIRKLQYNDFVYCFTMPQGTLITRFKGKPAFTGNCRLKKYLWKHSELLQLDALHLENLLAFKQNKINYIGGDPDYWCKDSGHVKIADVIIMHGDNRLNGAKGGKYAAVNTMLSINHSLVMGHTHRLSLNLYDNGYVNHFAINTGCLCQLPSMADWQQGFGTFEVLDGKGINPRVHQVKNGELYIDGIKYISKKKIQNSLKKLK